MDLSIHFDFFSSFSKFILKSILCKRFEKNPNPNPNPNTQQIENPNPDLNLWVLLGAYV